MAAVAARKPSPNKCARARGAVTYLGNPISLLDLEGNVSVIEEDNSEGSAVIFVDDAGANVDEVLGSETGSERSKMFISGKFEV